MSNSHDLTSIGAIENIVPLFQTEAVTSQQAEITNKNITYAFFHMSSNDSLNYKEFINFLREIHIVNKVENVKHKYDWEIIDNKAILKIQHDITYMEACYFLGYVTVAYMKKGRETLPQKKINP